MLPLAATPSADDGSQRCMGRPLRERRCHWARKNRRVILRQAKIGGEKTKKVRGEIPGRDDVLEELKTRTETRITDA